MDKRNSKKDVEEIIVEIEEEIIKGKIKKKDKNDNK